MFFGVVGDGDLHTIFAPSPSTDPKILDLPVN